MGGNKVSIYPIVYFRSPSDEQPSTITLEVEDNSSPSSHDTVENTTTTTTTTTSTSIDQDEYQIAIALVTNIQNDVGGGIKGNEEIGNENNTEGVQQVANGGIFNF